MAEPDPPQKPLILTTRNIEAVPAVEPSWKPLFWLVGGLALIIALGEMFFEFILELLETLGEAIFYVVEGSEELLEDKIEEWFDLDPYHAEIVTAWSMTPLKLLLAVLVLRWLWRLGRARLFPRIAAYSKRQYASVRLAWDALAWPYKLLLATGILGGLLILI
jgi:hypothetical protein